MSTSVSADLLTKIDHLQALLDSFPERLEQARKDQEHHKETLSLLQPRITDRENEVKILVVGEKGPDGKLVFSNETARKTEVERRLSSDTEYQRLLKEQDSIKATISNASRVVQRVEDERRSVEKQADLVMKAADIVITKVTIDNKVRSLKGDS